MEGIKTCVTCLILVLASCRYPSICRTVHGNGEKDTLPIKGSKDARTYYLEVLARELAYLVPSMDLVAEVALSGQISPASRAFPFEER